MKHFYRSCADPASNKISIAGDFSVESYSGTGAPDCISGESIKFTIERNYIENKMGLDREDVPFYMITGTDSLFQ